MSKQQVIRYVAMAICAALLIVVFIQLGQWQLRRLDERRERNATIVAHEAEPTQPYSAVMTKTIDDEDQWYRVTATGTYEPEGFQVRYRSLDGAYGSEIAGILKTTEGDYLLVNRGFLQRQPGHPDGDIPPTVSGEVTVTGYVRRNERGDETQMVPHEGGQLRLLNSDALSTATGKQLVNGFVALEESTPAETNLLTPIPPPELDEGPHL
ncbi:MAG TPA: SURF1 family protein, partial [Tessaracoccus flavescens]|nr:SURF1 family protein [Tessaracoccus flavescens]